MGRWSASLGSFKSSGHIVSNWRDSTAFDAELTEASEGQSALEVLEAAAREMDGRLVLLPSARRSAAAWKLDCKASDLHRALLGLESYATALREGLSREEAAKQYHARVTIPISQESSATWKSPTRRRSGSSSRGLTASSTSICTPSQETSLACMSGSRRRERTSRSSTSVTAVGTWTESGRGFLRLPTPLIRARRDRV